MVVQAVDMRRKRRMSAEGRRMQILKTATDLFSKRGYNGTTTKEIAESVGVSEAIIFRHFGSKQELYRAILDYKAGEAIGHIWTESMEAMRRKDDRAFFELLAREILVFHQKDSTLLRLLYYCALEGHELAERFYNTAVKSARDRLAEYIAERIRDGVFRQHDPVVSAKIFLGMVGNYAVTRELFQWSDMRSVPVETAAADIATVFLHGMLECK